MESKQLFSLILLVLGLTCSLDKAHTASVATYEQNQAQMAAFMDALSKLAQQNTVRIDRVEATLKTVNELASKCFCSEDPSTTPTAAPPGTGVTQKPVVMPDWLKNLTNRMKEIESTLQSQDKEIKKELNKTDTGLKDLNSKVEDLANTTKIIQDILKKHDDAIKDLDNSTKNAFKEAEERAKNFTDSTNRKISELDDSTKKILDIVKNWSPNITAKVPRETPDETKVTLEYTLFTDSKKNWYEAFADCRRRNLDLATFENEDEHQKILTEIKALDPSLKDSSFWVSTTDLGKNNSYVWMSSGQDLSYSKWCKNQPDKHAHFNNETEHCVELRPKCDYGMNDEICSDKNYYVCEARRKHVPMGTITDWKMLQYTIGTEDKLNWFEALADCKKRGLNLASIQDENDQHFVQNLIENKGGETGEEDMSYWVSASDLGKTGDYVWMTTGEPLNYTSWNTNLAVSLTQRDLKVDSNGEKMQCLSVKSTDHTWQLSSCSTRRRYICVNT